MIAARVRADRPVPVLRRCACGGKGECAECQKKRSVLRRSATATSTPGLAPPLVHDVLRSPGQPLDAGTRAYMEPRFGHSFADVRIHADDRAAESAAAVQAHAYAVGRDVVFGAGKYAPASPEGRRLIAHELAHVVQQEGASAPPARLEVGAAGDAAEGEAERAAGQALAGADARVSGDTTRLRRYVVDKCASNIIETLVKPADEFARHMVDRAVVVLTSGPEPAVAGILERYFGPKPDTAAILAGFVSIGARLGGDSYHYECQPTCGGKNAWVYDKEDVIHLCVHEMMYLPNDCIARTIVHEFAHLAAGARHYGGKCYGGCAPGGCPKGTSAADALANAYAYGGFAYDLHLTEK